MKLVTTFPRRDEFERAKARLDAARLTHEVVSPDPGYRLVGVPALAMGSDVRMALASASPTELAASGWVDYRPATMHVPQTEPLAFEEDVFGRAAIMVLAPCVADPTKIRLIAHLSGDLTDVFPYLNAEMREASYNVHGPTFTFMDRYRMVSVYPRRIAVAKADDIVDGWRTLERIRVWANDAWARRASIEPSWEMREKPPALEIFKRLPRTNCRACGELTCLAFAVRVWSGDASPSRCTPVFQGEHERLKGALVEICSGLGLG